MAQFEFALTESIRHWADSQGMWWIERTTTIDGKDSVVLYGPIDINSLTAARTSDGPIILSGKPIEAHFVVDVRGPGMGADRSGV